MLGGCWLTVLSSLVVVVVDWGCSPEQPARTIKGIAAKQVGKKYFMRSFLGAPIRLRIGHASFVFRYCVGAVVVVVVLWVSTEVPPVASMGVDIRRTTTLEAIM